MMLNNRLLILAVAAACLLPAAMANADTPDNFLRFSSQVRGVEPQTTVLSQHSRETVLQIKVPGVFADQVDVGGPLFTWLHIPSEGMTQQIGWPELPLVREMVAIPARSAVRVEVLDAHERVIEGVLPYPFQTPTIDADAPIDIDFDAAGYSYSGLYPDELVTVGDPAVLRDLRVVTLSFAPLRYDAARGELILTDSVVVRLVYEGTDKRSTLSEEPWAVDAKWARTYRSLVVNYRELDLQELGERDNKAGIDYLVIAQPAFADNAQALVDLWSAKGLTVSVVDTATAGTTDTAIKNYIQTEYNSATPADLDYVLLLGDIDAGEVPWHLVPYNEYGCDDGGGCPGDIWYGRVAGADVYADIGIGRISAANDTEVDYVLTKTENWVDQADPGDWRSRSLLVAHKEGAPGKYVGCSEEIRNYAYDEWAPVFDTAYGSVTGVNNATISAAVVAGRGLINYRGHGSTTEWWQWNKVPQSFSNSDADALTNGQRTPIIYSIACDNMYLSAETGHVFGEAWVLQDQGAVAFYSATLPSYTVPNHDFDKYLYRATWMKGITEIGYVANDALAELITQYGETSTYGTNYHIYLWEGDPAISVPFAPAPAALTGVASPEGDVALTWVDQSADEEGFEVERRVAEAKADWEVIDDTLAANSSGYIDSGLDEAAAFEYRVRSFKDEHYSQYSEIVAAGTPPLAPDGLAAEPLSDSEIKLTWSDNSAGEAGYRIWRKLEGEADFSELGTTAADAVEYVDESMAECTQATYKVTAFTVVMDSAATDEVQAMTRPAAPSELSAADQGDGDVLLEWKDNSNGETGYMLERSIDDDDAFEELAALGADTLSYNDNGLGGGQYFYRIKAISDEAGDSEYSNTADVDVSGEDDDDDDDSSSCGGCGL